MQPDGDRLGALREQVQLDVVVLGRRAAQHGPTSRGSNSAAAAWPRAPRCAARTVISPCASPPNRRWYSASASSISVFFGSTRAVGDAEALGRLALGGQEIADAVLGHDARGFLRERAAQVLGALAALLSSRHQKIGSAARGVIGRCSVDVLRSCCSPGVAAPRRQMVRDEVSRTSDRVRRRCASRPCRA